MNDRRTAVIFDLYGTLADVHVDEKSPAFWAAVSAEVFDGRSSVAGEQLESAYCRLLNWHGKRSEDGFLLDTVFAQLLGEFGVEPTPDNLQRLADAFRKHSIVYLARKDYASALLDTVRSSGYRIGLISNTEELLTRYDLRVLGLEDVFDHAILSSELGVKKPNRKIFEEMLGRLEVHPSEAAYVGDNFDDDVIGALNSGIAAVFLTGESRNVRNAIEGRYAGKVICADWSLPGILAALQQLGFAV
jgi:putative hydrolase of the HAD superfamily